VIAVLDVLVVITLMLFWRIRSLAGALLIPYLAWIAFATVLNWQFLELNPTGSGEPRGSGAVERYQL
jgi:benzodiazapine receptor